MTIPERLVPLLPELVVAGGAMLLLAICRVRVLAERSGDFTLLVVALAAVASVASLDQAQGWALRGLTVADPFAAFFRFLLAVVAMATVWLSTRSREAGGTEDAAGWAFFLVSLFGAFTMASASHAVAAWCGLTATSVAASAWAWRRALDPAGDGAGDPHGAAVSLLFGSVLAAATTLVGVAILHALAGTLAYSALPGAVEKALSSPGGAAATYAALALVVAGTGLLAGTAPWPHAKSELAGRSSLVVTVWTTAGGTLAGIAMLVRLVRTVLAPGPAIADGTWQAVAAGPWPELLSVAAMVTMVAASARALAERDLRRLVVWLAAVQSGAMLAGVAAAGPASLPAVLFHAVAFAMATTGLVAALAPVVEQEGTADIEALRGLARRGRKGRAAAGAISVFLFSLTALPPFAGYVGRTLLFTTVFEAGRPWLAGAAAVASAVGVLASIRLLATMLDRPAGEKVEVRSDFESALLAGLLLAGTVLLGVAPPALRSLSERAVVFFSG